jgi:hypothetical protein
MIVASDGSTGYYIWVITFHTTSYYPMVIRYSGTGF